MDAVRPVHELSNLSQRKEVKNGVQEKAHVARKEPAEFPPWLKNQIEKSHVSNPPRRIQDVR